MRWGLCLFGVCLWACSQPTPPVGFSLSLPRPVRAMAISAREKVVFVADVEVVRSLTLQGKERWGRRLDIGGLEELRRCGDALGVRGTAGAMLLDSEGRVLEAIADWRARCPIIKGSSYTDKAITLLLRSEGLSLRAEPSGVLQLEAARREPPKISP